MAEKDDSRLPLEELARALGTNCPVEALRRIAELMAVAREAEKDFAARAFNPGLDKALRVASRWLPDPNAIGGQ